MKNNSFKQIIENQLLRILSILAAIFLWFYVVNSEPVTFTQNLDVKIIPPIGKAVDGLSSPYVELEVKGARAFLNEYQDKVPSLILNLSKVNGNATQYTISAKDLHLPFGVELISVKPKILKIHFDRMIKKRVPITISKLGNLRSELEFSKEKLTPNKIMISGPVSAMRKVSSLSTVDLDINELSGSDKLELTIKELPRYITFEDETKILYEYSIRAKKANFNLKNIDITFITKDKNYKPNVKLVSVDVFAPDDIKIRKSDIKIFAEVPETTKNKVKVRLRAELPEDVHLLQINPPFIDITKTK